VQVKLNAVNVTKYYLNYKNQYNVSLLDMYYELQVYDNTMGVKMSSKDLISGIKTIDATSC